MGAENNSPALHRSCAGPPQDAQPPLQGVRNPPEGRVGAGRRHPAGARAAAKTRAVVREKPLRRPSPAASAPGACALRTPAQRFCQKCTRFHPLSAYEGKNRTCTEQQERQNARRRKNPARPRKARAAGLEVAHQRGLLTPDQRGGASGYPHQQGNGTSPHTSHGASVLAGAHPQHMVPTMMMAAVGGPRVQTPAWNHPLMLQSLTGEWPQARTHPLAPYMPAPAPSGSVRRGAGPEPEWSTPQLSATLTVWGTH